MGDIHYFIEMPIDQYRYDNNVLIVTPELFERIGDYTRSQPTSPSPGRIYRKNLGWHKQFPDNWWAYLCEPSAEEGYVDHRPLRLVVSTIKVCEPWYGGMPYQISDRAMRSLRYVWDARQRRWMTTYARFKSPL